MSRVIASFLCIIIATATAFTSVPSKSSFVSKKLFMADNEDKTIITSVGQVKERGVSIDQDGKSNVWAVEPKMEVDTKSAEEKMTGNLIAAGGIVAFAAVAGVVLTNLPDPNAF